MRVRLAVAVLLASLLLVPSGGVGVAAPARDTLVYASDISDMISLDPAVAYEFSGILVAQNIYDTLVAFEGEDLTTLKPRLARSWTIQDAGSAWKVTFKLRTGVKFSTGRPLTAKAVAFSCGCAITLPAPAPTCWNGGIRSRGRSWSPTPTTGAPSRSSRAWSSSTYRRRARRSSWSQLETRTSPPTSRRSRPARWSRTRTSRSSAGNSCSSSTSG